MTQEMKDTLVVAGVCSIGVATIAVCAYLGIKSHNKFAKYVMEHPEEYKMYQNVEKMKRLESAVSDLESNNSILRANNAKLVKKNEDLTNRLKGFVAKEYSEFFDIEAADEH